VLGGDIRVSIGTFIVIFLVVAVSAFCEYPQIKELNSGDILFKQLQSDLQAYFQASSRRKAVPRKAVPRKAVPRPPGGELPKMEQAAQFPPLRLFSYRIDESADLFALAARLNLPYDCLATLNGFDGPEGIQSVDAVLIPNQPGIFVWRIPESSFQEIVSSVSTNTRDAAQELRIERNAEIHEALFYRGASFTSIERAYFLNILFRFPLPFGRLTSGYGARDDPFTGHSEFHHGIDLAAPPGTEVYAARDGQVSATGYDSVLGKMIIVDHQAGYQTIYGHLMEITVRLNDEVRSGMIIGKVGSTGYSTGPHLHFEVRRRGTTRDPAPLLSLPKENEQ
jgi:murein DD-endopeptidase MepM/ murein hydrolase activator NlpD